MEEIIKFVANNGVSVGLLFYIFYKVKPALDVFLTDFRDVVQKHEKKNDDRLCKVEEVVDSLVKENLLRLIASPHVADGLKDAASVVLRDVQTRTDDRNAVPAPTTK